MICICDPIGIVVILIIIKVRYVRYAWILGVFVLSCCLILLHTYLRTDGLHLLFVVVDRLDRTKERREKERWRRTLHLPGGLLLGYVSTPSSLLYFISGEGEWRFPPAPTQKKEKKIRTDKTPLFILSPSQKSADLARVRDNQRRSRARRKEYLQELETKYWTCEQVGVGASAEIQAAARLVVNENKRLRALLMKYGISSREINGEGEETASSVVENLEAMLGKRRACGGGSGGTGGRADVVAAESCEKSLVAIRYGHSQMPDRGLRQLQMKGTIPSPQSSGNVLRENGGSSAGNTGVLQQQQQHSEAHQQQQHQQQQFATLRHTLPPQAPVPPQQNHTPMQSNTHTYATTSASASSSASTSSNPDHIYATTSTYSPGSSSSLYGGNNNNNNYPDYYYTQQHQNQQQNHQHNDFFAHNNLDIYSAAAAAVPIPQHQQHQQQNQHQQNQYQQQPNDTASCRDIADAIRCIRPSLTLQELDEEMGCHQLCDADGGGGGGGSSCGGGDGGNGDCKVPHYKAFELMDRLSN